MDPQRIRAFQDMTGVELATDVEIFDAPDDDDNDAAWRFLGWVDDEVLGAGPLKPDTRITAITKDGKRQPITVFACNPKEHER